MTWRMCSVLMLVLAGCGDSDGEVKPLPLTSGFVTTLPPTTVSTTDTDGSTDGSTDGATDTGAMTSMAGDSTEGPDEFIVLEGAFIDGGAPVDLPVQCRITFYMPGQIEPSSGVEQGGFLFQLGGFTIDAYPQSYAVESTRVPMVERGVEGYVAAQCDANGNGLFDDSIGGWFPGLPLQRVTVPASNVYISIQTL